MYTLKSTLKRGMTLSASLGLVVASFASMVSPAFADALNPLTERSLTLSSSSPGWAYTDGSENSTYAPPNSGANGQKTGNYFGFKTSTAATVKSISFQYCTTSAGNCAVPGSDATPGADVAGSTSDLNVKYPSATEISGATTTSTGTIALTVSTPTVTGTDTHFKSDLVPGGTIVTDAGHAYVIKSIASDTSLTLTTNAVETEATAAYKTSDFNQVVNVNDGSVTAVPGYTNHNPKYSGSGDPAEAAKSVAGNFIVMYYNGTEWVQSTGWTATAHNVENPDTGNNQVSRTADNNYIMLTNSAGQAFTQFQQVKVLFFATDTNYITNPGSGAFFVKINTYSTDYQDGVADHDIGDAFAPATDANVIDGGVTVANVMNQSIQITTKVLETMQFSVGTVDPDTLSSTDGTDGTDASNGSSLEQAEGVLPTTTDGGTTYDHMKHGTCDLIAKGMTASDPQNVLQLGNQSAESSLETDKAYATHSYWRLSSNSSAGATVYYSGHTLSNTSGDEIAPIGTTAAKSAPGSEQFGLAIAQATLAGANAYDTGTYGVSYATAGTQENAADNNVTGVDDSTLTDLGATDSGSWDYTDLNKSYHTPRLDPLEPKTAYANGAGTITNGGTAMFAFDKMSDTVPAAIASENSDVVDCVTAKMRYIANISATTPAGIYTTKINYIAAPQY